MHRFYLPPDRCRDATIELTERDAKHANKVLRLRERDRFTVLDGQGTELHCQAERSSKTALEARVLTRHSIAPLPFQLTLIQAVTKGKSMDLIVQKATELGCCRIVPVLSERSVVRCHEDEAQDKQEKWQTVAIEAIKQCGQPWLPQVASPLPLHRFLSEGTGDSDTLTLLASLQPGAVHPRIPLGHYAQEHGCRPRKLSVWNGPEGDFTPAEINAIKGSGALPITLGPLILRSETAALYTLSALNYELQSN